jgi:uracil-DNA glycosylase
MPSTSIPKKLLFDELINKVRLCEQCNRLKQRNKVLSYSNGYLDSPVIFIAEAPGRLGADKYGIPLYGDQTGRNFETFIESAGLLRQSIFITNAVLCNPRSSSGNNDSPKKDEIQNCSSFLMETIEIIKPKYIVTLGRTALLALNLIKKHDIKLTENAGKMCQWADYQLYPLFHPGPRALIYRTKQQQMEDYKTLSKYLNQIS